MTYAPHQYAEALYNALDGKSHAERAHIMKRFVTMLEKHNATDLEHRIMVQYEKIYLHKKGLRKVDVESASPLSDEVRKEIEKNIGGKILLTETVNEALVAGMTILVDDQYYIDASARTKINNLFS